MDTYHCCGARNGGGCGTSLDGKNNCFPLALRNVNKSESYRMVHILKRNVLLRLLRCLFY